MIDISPVCFTNKNGFQLIGMLEKPESEIDRSMGIILLSPGIKMRVAPHRLYNKMSSHFVKQGFTVLRFDFYGLGDAEGEIKEMLLADLYGSIQLGRYVDDTKCAIDWMSKECGIDKIILAGLCGGAITGLLTAQSEPRVKGLLALGIPVILDSSDIDPSKYLTDGQIDRLHSGYIRRLLSVHSWFRLLTFQSDYRVIWKIIIKNFSKYFNTPEKPEISSIKSSETKPPPDNINPLFAPAFIKILEKGKRVILIFSGSDRLKWEYDEKFKSLYQDELNEYKNQIEEVTIEKANHIVSLPEWQEVMFSASDSWFQKNFNENR
ncbi:MAG: hypothetical protein OQL06_12495 [Gammaproteobacteria bacterium]|nr:hypothetical protein [Gammaproteobacteria bacterium]